MQCPYCFRPIANAPDLAGQIVVCPHCARQLMMEAPPILPLEPSAPHSPAPTSSTRHAPDVRRYVARSRIQLADSILGIFDLGFKRYVTPIVVKVTWAIWLAVGGLWVIDLTFSTADF